jgi:hypothetical protein
MRSFSHGCSLLLAVVVCQLALSNGIYRNNDVNELLPSWEYPFRRGNTTVLFVFLEVIIPVNDTSSTFTTTSTFTSTIVPAPTGASPTPSPTPAPTPPPVYPKYRAAYFPLIDEHGLEKDATRLDINVCTALHASHANASRYTLHMQMLRAVLAHHAALMFADHTPEQRVEALGCSA